MSDYKSIATSNKLEVMWDRFEDCNFNDQFDFVYSCQTLEHAKSARSMLDASHRLLKQNGVMYLEVPSIEVIGDPRGVEEFFIDKHAFHFSINTLVELAGDCGFSVAQDFNSDSYNIKLLFRKEKCKPAYIVNSQNSIDTLLCAYPQILKSNRSLLRDLVETILRPLAKRQKVVYWGANRIFDALVKYGGLSPDDIYMLVDTYMFGKLDQSQGVAIDHPDYIRAKEPQVCVVLARSSESIIAKLAYDMGVRHVLKYSELIDQTSADMPLAQLG
jgi:hypothetical protein